MKFKRNILSLSVYSAVLALAGCGVTTQDAGTGDSGAGQVSGVAVDGYVALAVVYVDTNTNNKLDVWETRALTDARGYFTYSPEYIDGKGNTVAAVNYCELATTHADYTYCLKIPAGYDEVVVRMTRGIDLATSDKFTGTLSMMVSSNESTIAQAILGTPISGLLAEMTAEQKTNFYLTETGVDADLVKLNFLDFDTADLMTDAERRILLSLALKIHKVADSVAGVLDAALAQGTDDNLFGVKEGIPTDASVYVYRAIAEKITATKGVSALLSNQDDMAGIVSQAWFKMTEVVSAYNLKNPSGVYSIPATDPDSTSIATDSLRLAAVVGNVFSSALTAAGSYTDTSGATVDYTAADDAKARIRAVDILASLIRSGAAAAAITNAEALAGDGTYLTNLKSPRVDITGLKTKFVGASVGSLTASDADYAARQSFAEVFGDASLTTGLAGTDGTAANDEGFAGNTLGIGEGTDNVGISFVSVDENGDTVADATSGTMTIDASFAGGDYASGTDSDGDGVDDPLELEGTWEQIDEYTMLMNIEVAGVIEPVIVKPTLTEDGQPAYYFDLGGEQQIWIP